MKESLEREIQGVRDLLGKEIREGFFASVNARSMRRMPGYRAMPRSGKPAAGGRRAWTPELKPSTATQASNRRRYPN